LIAFSKSFAVSIFFLLISGWGLSPDPQNATRAGIDMMLKKPFRMEQLAFSF
jgi:response regulator RpfG family c-di-GMP phosphodiesterase